MQYTAIACKERVTALILHRARPPRGAAKEKAHTLPTERGDGFLYQVPNRAGSVGQGDGKAGEGFRQLRRAGRQNLVSSRKARSI